jgi:hypothetical protein
LDRVLIKLRIIRAKSTYPLYIVDVLTLVAASIFKKWIDELGEDIKQ